MRQRISRLILSRRDPSLSFILFRSSLSRSLLFSFVLGTTIGFHPQRHQIISSSNRRSTTATVPPSIQLRPHYLDNPYKPTELFSTTANGASVSHESSSSSSISVVRNNNKAANQQLYEVNVLYNDRQNLVYDAALDRYVSSSATTQPRFASSSFMQRLKSSVSVALLPAGVTNNYYQFVRWRFLQRFVNANLHVFGTQSLLLGLGIHALHSNHHRRALSAALHWVLKDALGKITRIGWAAYMGRRFDSDAKRWRFRSALIFAAGNGLEIVTYLFPNLFLVIATASQSLKQVSMLTSSSTRTTIYNSFRDNTSQNIGDITAKGEAQIAIVDLLGILSGVRLSQLIGTNAVRICSFYAVLQVAEIACMYQQLRAVQYRVLNFERMITVMERYCDYLEETIAASSATIALKEEAFASSPVHHQQHHHHILDESKTTPPLMQVASTKRTTAAFAGSSSRGNIGGGGGVVPTPTQLAATEHIFWPPKRLARRANAFGSFSRVKLSPTELEALIALFRRERFLLVVGPNVKKQRPHASSQHQENCHIILHEDATNVDIVKSTLALTLLRRRLATAAAESAATASDSGEISISSDPDAMRSGDCMPFIQEAYRTADQSYGHFLRVMSKEGWESPTRSLFGRVHMRAWWPLKNSSSLQTTVLLNTNTTISITTPTNRTGDMNGAPANR